MTPGALVMQRFLTGLHILVLTALVASPAGATVHGDQADPAPNAGTEGWPSQRQVPDEGWSAGYDGTDVVCELDSSGNVSAHMTYGPDGLVSRRSGSATTYYAFDALASVSVLTDSSGDAVSKHGWDAYGTSIGTPPSGPYGYGAQWGYYTDTETGLQLCTYRMYDPAVGRFVTRDPIGYAGGLNLYGYVGNEPTGAADPSGLAEWREVPRMDGDPWYQPYHHAYIVFRQGNCLGARSFGFWPSTDPLRGQSWIHYPDGAQRAGDPYQLKGKNNDVWFERALCDCIKESVEAAPRYDAPWYGCGRWVRDMWECAKREAYDWRHVDYVNIGVGF